MCHLPDLLSLTYVNKSHNAAKFAEFQGFQGLP